MKYLTIGHLVKCEEAERHLVLLNATFPEMMKKSILQEAVQGKLVPQDPNDEPASLLLKKIAEEKKRLIKEGKIKKLKPLPEITEDEIPFDIPESWEMVRLGEVVNIQSSKRVFEKEYVKEGIPFFRSKEIGDLYRGEDIQTQLYISREHYEHIRKEYGVPQKGDILITSVGTIGNTWICDGREFYYKDGNITQICKSNYILPEYLDIFIHSPLFWEQVSRTVAGTAYNALTIIKLKQIIFLLPPKREQERIVDKLRIVLKKVNELK